MQRAIHSITLRFLLGVSIIAGIFSVSVFVQTARADHELVHGQSLNAWWDWPASTPSFTEYSVTMKPTKNSSVAYYGSNVFRFENKQASSGGGDVGGYFGFQTKTGEVGNGKGVLFSIWDALDVKGPGWTGSFGGEGVGKSARLAYNWTPGTEYTFRLYIESESGSNRWWAASVTNESTNVTTKIGSILQTQSLGYIAPNMNTFLEMYQGGLTNCSQLEPFDVTYSDPVGTRNGTDYTPESLYLVSMSNKTCDTTTGYKPVDVTKNEYTAFIGYSSPEAQGDSRYTFVDESSAATSASSTSASTTGNSSSTGASTATGGTTTGGGSRVSPCRVDHITNNFITTDIDMPTLTQGLNYTVFARMSGDVSNLTFDYIAGDTGVLCGGKLSESIRSEDGWHWHSRVVSSTLSDVDQLTIYFEGANTRLDAVYIVGDGCDVAFITKEGVCVSGGGSVTSGQPASIIAIDVSLQGQQNIAEDEAYAGSFAQFDTVLTTNATTQREIDVASQSAGVLGASIEVQPIIITSASAITSMRILSTLGILSIVVLMVVLHSRGILHPKAIVLITVFAVVGLAFVTVSRAAEPIEVRAAEDFDLNGSLEVYQDENAQGGEAIRLL